MIRTLLRFGHERLAMQQARRWFARMNGGTPSAQDCRAFAAWLSAHPRNSDLYTELRAIWEDVGLLRDVIDTTPAPIAPAPSGNVRLRWQLRAIAATVLIGTVAFVSTNPLRIASDREPARTYATEVGETSDIRLPDRSAIKLGAKSAVRVLGSGSERRVELQSGEAFFAVASDPVRPFLVETAYARIRVIGTRFNAHTGPDGLSVVVEHGRVMVEPKSTPAGSRMRAGHASLVAGQKVIVSSAGEFSRVSKADIAQATAWQRGRLAFDDAPLATVAADINRHSHRRLTINDPALMALRVTGRFGADDVLTLVGALEATLPVRAVEVSPDEYLLVRSDEVR